MLLVAGFGVMVSLIGFVIGHAFQSQQISDRAKSALLVCGASAPSCTWRHGHQLRHRAVPVMGADQVVGQYTSSAAHSATDAARNALQVLLQRFFSGTEPNFSTIATTYNRMLAIALLLWRRGDRLCPHRAHARRPQGRRLVVLPRVRWRQSPAPSVLGLMQYAAGYANLLAHAWDLAFVEHGVNLAQKIQATYQQPLSHGQALGSAIGLILMSLLTVLLVVLVLMELVLRAALILVTTAFIPLVCVMAIWPRLTPPLTHMVEFLIALLLSKFVIITAVYIGFTMVAAGYGAPAADATGGGAMVVGLATLLVALLSPVILLQGIRFTHTAGATAVRGWSLGTFRSGTGSPRRPHAQSDSSAPCAPAPARRGQRPHLRLDGRLVAG